MNNIFSTLLAFLDLSCFQTLLVNGFTCKMLVYNESNFDGTMWNLSTNETLSKTWTGDSDLDFNNDEISSYKYYCASGYRCTFKFCKNHGCSSGWTFTESCTPGGNGTEEDINNRGSYNNDATDIEVSISATDPPTSLPTSSVICILVLSVVVFCKNTP